jgi:integrase
MARKINRLTARAAATLTERGRHADGGGLYLSVSPNGGRRWTFLFRWHGKPTEIGFGSARDVPLAKARELASQARALLAEGRSPKEARGTSAGASFGECADRVIAAMRPSWRSREHARQWETTLRQDAAALRPLPVSKITTDDVLGVLGPLWRAKPATASRLRGRIERVLDAAKAQGLRSGENPARWRGHLDQLLPKSPKLTRGHHAAMPFGSVGAFMRRLETREASIARADGRHRPAAARALEFIILTAARSGEALGARWNEFDLERAIWTVPAVRMKGGREHRVPLSPRALAIVRALHEVRTDELVFPGQQPGQRLGGLALGRLLARMKITDATVHGFRSSFRDWAAECTHYPNHVVEMALAHAIGDRVEAAYRRGDLFDKRRQLMDAWAAYCAEEETSKVLAFGR